MEAKEISSMAAEDLPKELIMEIFLKLPMKSLIRCRSVCKSWYNLFHDNSFIRMHFLVCHKSRHHEAKLLTKETSPLKAKEKEKIFAPFCKQWFSEYARFKIPGRIKGLISRECPYGLLGPCNGLVCIYGPLNKHDYHPPSTYNVFAWNPCTGEIKGLPRISPELLMALKQNGSKVETSPVACGFHCVPNLSNRDMDDYRVVMILQDRQQLQERGAASSIYIIVYSLNTNSWKKINTIYPPNYCVSFDWRDSAGLCLNGACNWIARRGGPAGEGGSDKETYVIVSITLDDRDRPKVREIKVPTSLNVFSNAVACPLVSLKGPCLGLVSHHEFHQEFIATIMWKMEEYGNEKSWKLIFESSRPAEHKMFSSMDDQEEEYFQKCGIFLETVDDELVLYDKEEFSRRFSCDDLDVNEDRDKVTDVIVMFAGRHRWFKETIVSPSHQRGCEIYQPE